MPVPASPPRGLDAIAPGLFVLLWSTGFIGAKLGLPHGEPLVFLGLRFLFAAVLLVAAAMLMGAAWPRRGTTYGHLAVAGLLVHAVYLGGVFVAIHRGVPAGITALVVCLQPLVTGALAGPLLGERVGPRQWLGLLLGFAGAAMVLSGKLQGGGGAVGLAAAVVGLAGITAGTLYQKRFCGDADLCAGNAFQYLVAAAACLVASAAAERMAIDWTPDLVIAFLWLTLVLSVGAITLFYRLIRRGTASRVASLMYLVPPLTALLAWLLFGEVLGPLALIGMAVTAIGVALVNR